ncbi:MAG: hypothetical protein RR400_01315 [Clostridia bacterium]
MSCNVHQSRSCGCGCGCGQRPMMGSMPFSEPIAPKKREADLGGSQVEMLSHDKTVIANNQVVVFNNVLNGSSANISYSITNGVFSINKAGVYLASWWVNLDQATQVAGQNISFGIKQNGGVPIVATASAPSGQIFGTCLISVDIAPLTLTLNNVSGVSVTLGDASPKAGLSIVGVF